MAAKNSHYKLDFKVKDKNDKNLTLKDFRRHWYWGTNDNNIPAISSIVTNLIIDNKLSTLIPDNFDIKKTCEKLNIVLNNSEQKEFVKYVELGREKWHQSQEDTAAYRKNGYNEISYNVPEKFDNIIFHLASLTSIFQTYETAFQDWLKKRPGLREVWDEQKGNEKPTIKEFAKLAADSNFRNKIENARPRTLKIGTLVQLKEKFINNRSKDPFYWNEEHKISPRLGMISKLNEHNAYGYGSRLLRIMWIANSEESTLMERDLKILSE